MDFEENMAEEISEQGEDLLPEELIEDPEETGEDLDAMTWAEDETADEEPEEEPKAKAEPGYVQKRISKAVDKVRAEMQADFSAQMEALKAQYAPLQERLMEMDAQELVKSHKVGDIETARELVRLRQGMAAQEPVRDEQPRQENGQFAPKEDPATMARIDMLKHQATQIKADSGLDVIAEWNSNEEIKNAVINGEMDFYDVAKQMQKPQTRRRPPAPTRSPNGTVEYSKGVIMSMSDKQFEAFEKKVQGGTRFRAK
jgi:hypothetical protein